MEQLRADELQQPGAGACGRGLDAGVIGIVSARMLERFGKPVVLLSLDGDTAVGSARSMPEFPPTRRCPPARSCWSGLEGIRKRPG